MTQAPHWAASYFGIPFKDRGATRSGCDCWGLYRLILLERAGVLLPFYADIPAGASLQKLEIILDAASGPGWERIEPGREQAFDAVLLRGVIEHDGRRYSRPIHIGCVVEPGKLIHIEAGCEVTIADYRNHPRVRRRVEGFYRYLGGERC